MREEHIGDCVSHHSNFTFSQNILRRLADGTQDAAVDFTFADATVGEREIGLFDEPVPLKLIVSRGVVYE